MEFDELDSRLAIRHPAKGKGCFHVSEPDHPIQPRPFQCSFPVQFEPLFEDAAGGTNVNTALTNDYLPTGRLKTPSDHKTRHLGRINLPFIGGNDIVTTLHHSSVAGRATEPDATDRYLVSVVEDNAITD